MEVNVESTGALTRSLHVEIPAEEFETEVGSRLKQIAKRARVAGFRPGRAPMSVIQRQYGANARAEVVGDIVQRTYPEAVEKAGVAPASMPEVEIEKQEAGQPLGYVAHFDVLPVVELDKLETLEVERPTVEVTDADIDKLVDNLRKSKREWNTVERVAALGDQVNIDFEGKLDGEVFPGGKGEKTDVELGGGHFVEDLENAIVGHAAGDEFTADVKFPDDYRAEDLAGKTAQFEVVVHAVQAAELPAIDAEFLKGHGVEEDAGEAGLRDKCRTALESERDKAVKAQVKETLMTKLLEAHPIEVPPSRVEAEIERLRKDAAERMGLTRFDQKMSDEKLASMLPSELFDERAQRNVALGLLLSEFISERKLEAEDSRVDKLLEDLAARYDNPESVQQYYRSNEQLMNNLRSVALEEQAVDALLEGAKVSDKAMPLDDLLGNANAAG